MRAPQLFSFASGQALVYSARSPSKKSPNEDSAALLSLDEHSGVLVVADGLGGARGGHHASSLAVKALRSSLEDCLMNNWDLREGIMNGFENANRSVLNLNLGAGTTLSAVEVQDSRIRPYHVGDSFVLVVGRTGKVKLQTVSHSPVGYAIEAGLLNKGDAMSHEGRHVVSNIVGSTDMRIEVGPPIELKKTDTVLLASDGVSDNLHLEEIVEIIRSQTLAQVGKKLVERAVYRMKHPRTQKPSKPDDLTFIAFRLK